MIQLWMNPLRNRQFASTVVLEPFSSRPIMEDELYAFVYRLLCEEGNKRPRRGRSQYRDGLILAVYFWAVVHDRPTCWACRLEHWPVRWQWLSLPSQPTMSRRLRRLSGVLLLMAVMERLRDEIERRYGNCSSFGGGLQPLPSCVRTPQRVARWLWAKLILNGLRICIHQGLAA